MEEPLDKELCAQPMHKVKAAYIGCGMAVAVAIGIVTMLCIFSSGNESVPNGAGRNSEVYILKDEVVDTSYLHGSVQYR